MRHSSWAPHPTAGLPLPGFEHIQRTYNAGAGKVWAKILPGEFYVSSLDEEIVTVLGSCISVCLRDAEAGLGGMNHFLLPKCREDAIPSNRYGVPAMENLLETLMRWGGRRANFEIKITGGGNIGTAPGNVAADNIAFIDRFLVSQGLRAVARDVGGEHPRKIHYHPLTGRLRIHKLPVLESEFSPRVAQVW